MSYSIYFNEYNIPTGNSYYLPLVSGMLASHLHTIPYLSSHFMVEKFLFKQEPVQTIINEYNVPDVACFSVFMWNEQHCLAVAREIKKLWPTCLIIFGGAQVPHNAAKYLMENSCIDIACRGEGENQFIEILESFIQDKDYSSIGGLTYKDLVGKIHYNEADYPIEKHLNSFQSPYLSGVFNPLIIDNPSIEFKAIIETNRGCPFHCAYCYWGGLNSRMRMHSLEKVFGEIEWCAAHKIEYVFCADSNFGMLEQDIAIAEKLRETKEKYGYPQKFRACYGKNCEQQVSDVAAILDSANMCKSMTLSLQSTNIDALINVGRKNISDKSFAHIQQMMNIAKIPVYTELILGLPGETFESWAQGLDNILSRGLSNQLFIYLCQIYINSAMGAKEYQTKFDIKKCRIELQEIHATPRHKDMPLEYQDIIVSTYSMPTEDWKKMVKVSWVLMTLFSLKTAYYIMLFLKNYYHFKFIEIFEFFLDADIHRNTKWAHVLSFFDDKLENILRGKGLGELYKDLPLYYDVEEIAFLLLSEDWDAFYSDIAKTTALFLKNNSINISKCKLDELIQYQAMCMPTVERKRDITEVFTHNWYTFFKQCTEKMDQPTLLEEKIKISVKPRIYTDLNDFATSVILRGRKSDAITNKHILN